MFDVAILSNAWWSSSFGNETSTYLKTTKSTQIDAKNNLTKECSNHGHLFTTSNQTHGKGRGLNTWITPSEGSTFLASFLHRLPSPAQPILTPLFGWAVYKSLNETFKESKNTFQFSVKAPNDIYLNDKKVAGLLLDSLSQGDENWIVFGLGLNVFDSPTAKNEIEANKLAYSSTSLKEEALEVDEKTWTQFLEKLSTHLTVASQMSLNTELEQATVKELLKALKKFKHNKIKNLTPSGDLELEDKTIIPWRSL